MSSKKFIVRLIDHSKDSTIEKWKLKANETYVIGRGGQSQIIISEEGVSRKHAEISVFEDSVTIKDLGSANGTYIDNEPSKPNKIVFLKSGMKIHLGDSDNYLLIKEKDRKSRENSDKKSGSSKKAMDRSSEERESSGEREKEREKARDASRERERSKEQVTSRYSSENKWSAQKSNLFASAEKNQHTPQQDAKEKRKLLWSNKKSDSSSLDEKAQIYGQVEASSEETNKFFKLMGFKQSVEGKPVSVGSQNFFIKKSGQEKSTMNRDLENQFNEGVKRKSGARGGLGTN